jgi:acyl-CoA thioester hydrolase
VAFELEITPRFRDIDSLGHVNNAVYLTYMEEARTKYYMQTAQTTRLDEIEFILASAKVDFRSPIAWGETVVIRVWPTRIGTSSFTLGYEMRVKGEGRLAAEAESVQVAYDYATKKSTPIPAPFRRALEAELPATR